MVSLPVDAKTLHQQQQTAQQYSTAQWAADRRAWWGQPPQNTYLAPSNTAAQDKLLQHLAELKDKPSSSSDSDSDSDSEDDVGATQQGGAASAPGSSGGADVNPDDIIVMEEGGDESSSDEEDESEEEEAAAAAGGKKGAVAGYPCALPLTYLLTLPKQVRGVQCCRGSAVLRLHTLCPLTTAPSSTQGCWWNVCIVHQSGVFSINTGMDCLHCGMCPDRLCAICPPASPPLGCRLRRLCLVCGACGDASACATLLCCCSPTGGRSGDRWGGSTASWRVLQGIGEYCKALAGGLRSTHHCACAGQLHSLFHLRQAAWLPVTVPTYHLLTHFKQPPPLPTHRLTSRC